MSGFIRGSPIPPAQLRHPPPDRHLKLIEDAAARLQQVGVPGNIFLPATFLTHGYTDAAFARLLRVIINVGGAEKVEPILLLGISHNFFPSVRDMQADGFYSFLRFLRSPQGQTALSRMAQQKRLARRGGGVFTAQQIGWIAMFDAQRSDFVKRTGDLRREHEQVIADLELQLHAARATMDVEIEAARNSFFPAVAYTAMNNTEFNKACWAEYTTATAAAGAQPVELNEANLTEVVHTFGNVIRQRHILTFLQVEGHEHALHEYINQKIGQFDEAREERAAKRLRGLLATVGAEVPAAVPVVVQEGILPENESENLADGAAEQAETNGVSHAGARSIPPRHVRPPSSIARARPTGDLSSSK